MYKKNTFKKNHYIISSYYKMSQETQIGNLGGGISDEDAKLVDSILNDINSTGPQQGQQGQPQQEPPQQGQPNMGQQGGQQPSPEQIKMMQQQQAMQQQQMAQRQAMQQQQMAQQQAMQQQQQAMQQQMNQKTNMIENDKSNDILENIKFEAKIVPSNLEKL